MIVMTYACSACDFTSGSLDDAQLHADRKQHVVTITGTITERLPVAVVRELDESLERKVRENTVMRAAKARGLV